MVLTSAIRIRNRPEERTFVSSSSLRVLVEVAVPVVIIVLWWILSAGSTNVFFPSLENILSALVASASTITFWSDVGSSVGNLLISFLLATVIGVAAGTLMGLNRVMAWLLEPLIHFFRAIPPVALIPIIVSLIGFGNETRILSITLASVFPILIATSDGIRGTEPTLSMVSRVYRFGFFDRLFNLALPAASPRIFAGMQVSLIIAFVVMIASEMLGSSVGLGARTLIAQQAFVITDMWAGILVLGLLGYLLNSIFTLIRKRMLGWYIASQIQEKNS